MIISRVSSKKFHNANSERFELLMQKFAKKLLRSVLRKASPSPLAQFMDACAKKVFFLSEPLTLTKLKKMSPNAFR